MSSVWRTNRVGARFTARIESTTAIDVSFDTTFQTNLQDGQTATPGTAAIRAYPVTAELHPPPFRYVPAAGQYRVIDLADAAVVYRLEIVSVRLGQVHRDDRSTVRGTGRWFNPEGPFPDAEQPAFGAFIDVTGIGVTSGGYVVADTSLLPTLDVLVLGDAALETALAGPGHAATSEDAFAERGVTESYVRALLAKVAVEQITPARRLRIVMLSHDEMTLREPTFPSVGADRVYFSTRERWEQGAGVDADTGAARPRDPYLQWPGWAVDWMAQLVAGTDYVDFNPEICLIALGAVDAERVDLTDPDWPLQVRDGLLGIAYRLVTLYGVMPVVVFKPHVAGPTGASPWGDGDVDLIDNAIDYAVETLPAAPYNIPEDALKVFALKDVAAASPGFGVWSRLLSVAQHRVIADALYSEFATFCDDALSTAVPTLSLDDANNSGFVAAL